MSSRPSTSSSSTRPPQSMAPQSMAPQSSRPPQMSGVSRSSSSAFDPRAAMAASAASAAGGAPKHYKQSLKPISAETRKIVPSSQMMQQACKIALTEDKPIILTFWHDSMVGNVHVNNRNPKEMIIEKINENSDEEAEYTSPIKSDHGNGIYETENSIYIVVPDIKYIPM
jgi:hypothetical protein